MYYLHGLPLLSLSARATPPHKYMGAKLLYPRHKYMGFEHKYMAHTITTSSCKFGALTFFKSLLQGQVLVPFGS